MTVLREEGPDVCARAARALATSRRTGSRTAILLALPAFAAEDDVVVEEATTAPDPGATSASLTVIPLGTSLPPGRDLASELDRASGTTVRRLGGLGDFAAVSLRGSTFRQVEVFLDGLPLNPDGAGVVDLSELPASAFSRVDVYRGNAPVAYGSSAMGGVLDLVTPDHAGIAPAVGAAGGSWGTARAWAVVGPVHGETDTFFAVDHLHTEGDWPYFDDRGTDYNLRDDRTPIRTNNAIDRTSAVGRVRLGPPSARLTLLDSFAQSHQELPGPINDPASLAAYASLRDLVAASLDWHAAPALRVTPRAWGTWRREDMDDRGGELGVGPGWTRDHTTTAGAQVEAAWAPDPRLVATALLRGRRERYVSEDRLTDVATDPRTRLGGTAAVGAQVLLLEERLVLTPVVQVELLDDRLLGEVPYADAPFGGGDDAARGTWVLPRGGVLLRPLDGVSLKANAGLYHRPPDMTELFGDHGTSVGSTTLVPEQGFSADVGARLDRHIDTWLDVSVDAAYARSYSEHLIVWVQNSQLTQGPVNLGKAYVRTTEGALDLDLLDVLRSTTNLTWTMSRNLDPDPAYADNALPRLPALEVSQQTSLRWGDLVEVAHTWSHTSATFLDTANLVPTAPRSLHGASLRLTPVPGLPTVAAEVLNLLDVRGAAIDRNPLSDEDDTLVVKPLADFGGYPLPGRTVMVSVSWTGPTQK